MRRFQERVIPFHSEDSMKNFASREQIFILFVIKPVSSDSQTSPPPRLLSLDAFRGATIAAMMMANNAGDWGHVFPPLSHAEWDGWTFTDTIFPSFLWIVGVAIP